MDPSTLFTLPSNDWSLALLGTLFTAGGVLSQTLALYNSIIMIGAVALMFYLATHAIVETAHTGKVLGNWSEVWWPVRMVIAIGLVAPLPPDGLNAAQQGFYLAAEGGIAGANTIWNLAVTQLATNLSPLALPASPQVDALGRGLFVMAACSAAANTLAANGGNAPWVSYELVELPGRAIYAASGDRSQGFKERTCGAVIFTPSSSIFQAPASQATFPGQGLFGGLLGSSTAMDPIAQALLDGHINQTKTLLDALAPIAQAVVASAANTTSTAAMPSAQAVPAALQAYSTAMMQLARGQIQGQNDQAARLQAFTSEATQSGWASAGAYVMRVADINGLVLRAGAAVPQISPPDLGSGFSKSSAAEVRRMLMVADQWWQANLAHSGRPEQAELAYMAGVDSNDFLGQIGFRDGLFRAIVMSDQDLSNPLAALIGLGHKLIEAFWTIAAGIAAAMAVAGAATVGGNDVATIFTAGGSLGAAALGHAALAVGQVIGWLPMLLMLGALSAGITFAYIIPALFFLYWVFAMQQWLQRIALGMLAAPIWALAHMNPDGAGVMGNNAHAGYALLVETLLRPMIMVIGLLLAVCVILGMSPYALQMLTLQVNNSLAGHPDFITGAIVHLVIGAGMMIGIVTGSLVMITKAPGWVMEVAGIRSAGGGDESDHHANVVVGGAKGASSRVETVVGQAAQRGASGAGTRRPGPAGARGNDLDSAGR